MNRILKRGQPFGLWSSKLLQIGLFSAVSTAIAAQDIGHEGPSLAGSGPSVGRPSVCESKPQSKLWNNDGFWWGSLWSSSDLAFHIQRLNAATHDWVDTGVEIESRPDSHSDILWDGTKLYVVSHEFSTSGGSPGDDIILLRYSYNTTTNTYTKDAGFPVTIGDSSTEAAVIEKDSTGRLWVVWTSDQRIYVTHSLGSHTAWNTPTILPRNTSDLDSDDLCSIIRFGNRIGVLWSDQVLNRYAFSTHLDGAADTAWSPVEVALAGESDDHIHLESAAGRVFAVVKNADDDIKLLMRAAGGGWSQFLVSDGNDVHLSRPIVLLNEQARTIDVFATLRIGANIGGDIHKKTSSLDNIGFAPGAGTTVLHDDDFLITDATSTKQNLTNSTGLVVLAANDTTAGTYWHHEQLGAPPGNNLVLAQPTPGQAGTNNTLRVTGATPGAVVGFYTGLNMGSSVISHPSCPGGVEVDLASPYRRLGTARANQQGVATLVAFIPASAAGKTFHFQSIEPASCRSSNLVSEQL